MVEREEIFHAQSASEVLKFLDSDSLGLSKEEASRRLKKFGPNDIPEGKRISNFTLLIRQLKSLMIYILIAAAGISFFLERYVDVYVILVVIAVNTTIGFYQETRAEQAIKAIKKMIILKAKVFRSGDMDQIAAKYLVPGDVIFLEEGDKIPADARIIEVKNFRTVESSLTGESVPVDKTSDKLSEKISLGDKKNMVWLGTFVAAGWAKAVVTSTGQKTVFGKIAKSIQEIKPRRTHFQETTDRLARHLAMIAVGGALMIFLVGFFLRGFDLSEILLFTLASLVSGIPEGLPSVLSTVLAVGAYRMAKRKAIIRDRFSTETLGIVDTIVTDKTGTLTENTMTVQRIILPGQSDVVVSGTGWLIDGSFYQNENEIIPLENKQLTKLLHIGAYCNTARLIRREKTKKCDFIGDPTEAALLVLAEKAGMKIPLLVEREKKIDEIPFNSETKYRASLSTLVRHDGVERIYVIGAPEAVMKKSKFVLKNNRKSVFTEKDRDVINEKINSLTDNAMRVIGLAYKEVNGSLESLEGKDTFDLIFVGVVGMTDPPRPEVKEAIEKARKAGIRVIMATGDHKNTAIAIAREIGMAGVSEKLNALTGLELSEMSDAKFEEAVMSVNIFARLSPAIKLKIAKVLQDKGKVVAMTGDGINDAPALKQADVGVSMGKIGTDVAREASEVVLVDDNFASIIDAVEEGRTVFVNTRQTSFFLLATGFAQNAAVISTMAIGLPLPLLPTQVLWLNIVTAGVNDVSLATEKSRHDIINEPPRKKSENIVNKEVLPFILILTLIMVVLTLLVYNYYLPQGLVKARTVAFVILSFTQVFNMFTMRSLKSTIFKIGFTSNRIVLAAFFVSLGLCALAIYLPAMQKVFEFTALTAKEMIVLFALSSSVFWTGELYKIIKKKD